MADSKTSRPTPSTSGVKVSKNDAKVTTQPPPNDEEDDLTLRSLDIISKISVMLKTESNSFITILEKVLALVEGDKIQKKKLIYSLVENVMSNILEADMEELDSAKQHFEKIFSQKKCNDLLIHEKHILRLHPLGQGGFSYVSLGLLRLPNTTEKKVAIKRAKIMQYTQIIENEAVMLQKLKHKNIIKMYGKHHLWPEIILELMDLGNLLSAVDTVSFSRENLVKLLGDVALAMEYVSRKKYLHRDIACRNVFLNKKKQCKLGDFGFAVYVGDTDGVYIERVQEPNGYNISPESLFTKAFTVANDVWAVGILCWELFYITEHSRKTEHTNITGKKNHIELFLRTKEPLPKSKLCPDDLYVYIMNGLLNFDPKKRPNFTDIRIKINEIASKQTS